MALSLSLAGGDGQQCGESLPRSDSLGRTASGGWARAGLPPRPPSRRGSSGAGAAPMPVGPAEPSEAGDADAWPVLGSSPSTRPPPIAFRPEPISRAARGELSYESLCELEDVRPVASLEAVDALAWNVFGDGAEGSEMCTICLSDYEVGEALIGLPCGHRLHSTCGREWLLRWSKRCPECKRSALCDDDD